MSMVEPGNCWDAIPNGGEDELDNILNILDFPLESLEDDGFVADWDIGESQCLGPIPSNELMGSAAVAPHLSAGLLARNDGSQDQKQQFNLGSANCPHHSLKLNEAQESSTFHTQSPVCVLESSGSCSAYHKSLPPTSTMPIPMRARSRRPKRAGPNPWLSALSHFSTSKWASIPRREKFKMKKSLDEAERLRVPPSSDTTGKCTHCEVTKTPQWREGPLGPKTLCNACGVRYRLGRLFPEYRPAASPTFVSFLHSNSHKKVIEMRKRAKKLKVKTEERPASSPQPEFIPMSNHLFDFIY